MVKIPRFFIYWIMLAILVISKVGAAVEVSFDGRLIRSPCKIDLASVSQEIKFRDLTVKELLYPLARGRDQNFSIKFYDCDKSSLFKTIKVRFNGVKEGGMEGDNFLAISEGPNIGKIAIGILDTDGRSPLNLGMWHNNGSGTFIEGNEIVLKFKAFVQAVPEALSDRSIVPGGYQAIVVFFVDYE